MMIWQSKRWGRLLLAGDLFSFLLALWAALAFRYFQLPAAVLFWQHLIPFSVIFLLWVVVFSIFDLYHLRSVVFNQVLPKTILKAQAVNSVAAVAFFYFVPSLKLTPKTILFIYLLISFLLIWWWRSHLFLSFYWRRGRPTRVRFACAGPEVDELLRTLTDNQIRGIQVVDERPEVIVFNAYDRAFGERLNGFYQQLFHGVDFLSVQGFYEEVLGRVPLGLINDRWFLEHISPRPRTVYDSFKRLMDIGLSLILGVLTLPVAVLAYLALKSESPETGFFVQTRIGRHNRLIKILKFRTMKVTDHGGEKHITPVGRVLRATRIDELPQLWNVFAGDLSLIGPRPELPEYVAIYRNEIPFYEARHLIAPGLSGWAQVYHRFHPHYRPSSKATAEKLSYDLYYLKNRSFWLDVKIALLTVKILLSPQGR